MTQLKRVLTAALLIAVAPLARALSPVTIETNWNVKTFSVSTTGVTSASFDIGGFDADGFAILGHTAKYNGVDGTTYGATGVVTSTWTNVVGFSYSAMPIGGSASLKISQTIKTPPNPILVLPASAAGTGTFNAGSAFPSQNYFAVPLISTSTTITIPNGVPVSANFEAVTANPIFAFTGLTPAATLYFTVDFGVPHAQ